MRPLPLILSQANAVYCLTYPRLTQSVCCLSPMNHLEKSQTKMLHLALSPQLTLRERAGSQGECLTGGRPRPVCLGVRQAVHTSPPEYLFPLTPQTPLALASYQSV